MNEAGTPPTKEVRTAAEAAPKRAQALRRGFGIALLVAALVALGRLAGGRDNDYNLLAEHFEKHIDVDGIIKSAKL